MVCFGAGVVRWYGEPQNIQIKYPSTRASSLNTATPRLPSHLFSFKKDMLSRLEDCFYQECEYTFHGDKDTYQADDTGTVIKALGDAPLLTLVREVYGDIMFKVSSLPDVRRAMLIRIACSKLVLTALIDSWPPSFLLPPGDVPRCRIEDGQNQPLHGAWARTNH